MPTDRSGLAERFTRVEDGSVTPGLDTLRVYRSELRTPFIEGFDSRVDILLWMHTATVATLGELESDWSRRILGDSWKVAALLADAEKREGVTEHPPSDVQAENERLDLWQTQLAPAFSAAVKVMRDNAGQYTDKSGPVDDLTEQRFVAVRPFVSRVAGDQREVITTVLGHETAPPTTRAALVEWAEDAVAATLGYADTVVDDSFVNRVVARLSPWYDSVLTADWRRPPVMLQQLVVTELFPAATYAIRTAVTRANEQAETVQSNREVPPG